MNGENSPVGSIGCAGKSGEQVELLAKHSTGLPCKKELEATLYALLIKAGQELRTKNFWNSNAECNQRESQLNGIGSKYGHFRKNKRLTGGVAN